jgi:hypothetical protein
VSEPHPDHRSDSTATWWEETPAVASLDFGLARTFSDFDGAFRLLHDQYVWRQYMRPNPAGRRLNLHNVLPTTKVFVARAEARVVGTLAAVEDSRLGLPMDEAFGAELGRLRERGRGAPVIGLRLDLGLVRGLLRSERAGLSSGPHASFLCGPQGYSQVMPRLRRDLPKSGLTPPEWARLFAGAGPPEPGRPEESWQPSEPGRADLSTVQLAALAGAVHLEPGGQP